MVVEWCRGCLRKESQSNGRAEEAGKTVRGFARVMMFQQEEHADIKIETVGTVFPAGFQMGSYDGVQVSGRKPIEKQRMREEESESVLLE